MNNDVLTQIADQFSEIEMKVPVDQIYDRARTRRTRRRTATAVATAAALAGGLTAFAVAGSGTHQPPPVPA